VRQAVLIVVLVTASFLGGAYITGPGLRWAQLRLLRSLRLSGPGEIASIHLAATGTNEAGAPAPVKDQPVALPGPLALPPSVITEADTSKNFMSSHGGDGTFSIVGTNRQTAASDMRQSPTGESAVPNGASVDSTLRTPVRLDAKVAPAVLKSATGSPPSARSSLSKSHVTAGASPQSEPKSVSSGDWVVIERRMQSLGISRFTIEGQPGGRVVFSCLIPLAGRQAVTERFEAEGDDVVQTAQTTLRRIALWRATQPSSH
jgi:hypothetical protein